MSQCYGMFGMFMGDSMPDHLKERMDAEGNVRSLTLEEIRQLPPPIIHAGGMNLRPYVPQEPEPQSGMAYHADRKVNPFPHIILPPVK